MLMPRKVKHRKQQRGRLTGQAKGGTLVTFGEYGIQALEPGWITARQIEAARIAMTRHVRRGGKVWIRVFPDKPVTTKPAETRMGSGKGNPEYWVAVVKPGRILFELGGVNETLGPSGAGAGHTEAADPGPGSAAVRAGGGGGRLTKTKDLRELTPDELEQKLVESKQELFNLRFQVATGKQDNSVPPGPRAPGDRPRRHPAPRARDRGRRGGRGRREALMASDTPAGAGDEDA